MRQNGRETSSRRAEPVTAMASAITGPLQSLPLRTPQRPRPWWRLHAIAVRPLIQMWRKIPHTEES